VANRSVRATSCAASFTRFWVKRGSDTYQSSAFLFMCCIENAVQKSCTNLHSFPFCFGIHPSPVRGLINYAKHFQEVVSAWQGPVVPLLPFQ